MSCGCDEINGNNKSEKDNKDYKDYKRKNLIDETLLKSKVKQIQKDLNLPAFIVGIQTEKQRVIVGKVKTLKQNPGKTKTSNQNPGKTKSQIKAKIHTRIGSITKTFIVTLLLQLAERNILSLDDPISKCLRAYEGVKGKECISKIPNQNAALRNLATMTSGISNYTENKQFQDLFFSNPYRIWSPFELLCFVDPIPHFPPGTKYEYSNTNDILIGIIIEQVTKCKIEDLLQKYILRPLKLKHTIFPNTSPCLPKPYWRGYTTQGNNENVEKSICKKQKDFVSNGGEIGYYKVTTFNNNNKNNNNNNNNNNNERKLRKSVCSKLNVNFAPKLKDSACWNPSWAWTAGGMISNVKDLLKWGFVLGTGANKNVEILTRKTQVERLLSFNFDLPIYNQTPKSIDTSHRAYGLGIGFDRGWIGHGGQMPGFDTLVLYSPRFNAAIVLMANTDTQSLNEVAFDILRCLGLE